MKNGAKGSDSETEKLNPNRWVQPRPSQQFNVIRRVYQQDALNKDADYHVPNRPLGVLCKKAVRNCGFGECFFNSLPIVKWLPRYDIRKYLLGDTVAGATTAVMHIPQGMAYALLAEVPPIYGLYMAFFPILMYVILGTSPHVSIGTFAVACLMVGKVVNDHALKGPPPFSNTTLNLVPDDDFGYYIPVEVVTAVCITCGIMQVAMWALRLGAVSSLLSEPLVSGFTTAAAAQVMCSQLKDVFGLTLPKLAPTYKNIYTLIEVFKNMPSINYASLVISFTTCLVLSLYNELLRPWISKRSRIPVPVELLAIMIGTLVSRYCFLHDTYGVTLVGAIPTGLPMPKLPPLELIPKVALDSITITMVTYTITMSMALIFANKDKYEIDANQELLALGACNVFGSFFCCAPVCASLSRSYIQYQAGSKTPLTLAVSALLVLGVLLWVGPAFESLPRAVLAGIIVASLRGMFAQVRDLARFWKLSRLDAAVWLVTFLVTALVAIDVGLGAGILASVGALFCRSQKPYTCLLGRVLETDLYLDIKRYRAAEELPGIKIFHYCGGLNFASKTLFRSTLFRKIGYLKPTDDSHDEDNNLKTAGTYEWDHNIANKVHCVIIDATALSYVDAPGVRSLLAVQQELVASHIVVLMAGANAPVLEMIETYNSLELAKDRLQLATFPTVHDAVVFYKVLESKKNSVGVTITSERQNGL